LPSVGGYALVQRLSSGTWCEVFRARPSRAKDTAADYVVKTVRAGVNDRDFAAALLQREATVAAEVSHPNLPALLDAELAGESPFLLFPFSPGLTAEQLTAGSRLKPELQRPVATPQALWYVRQAAAALTALHSAGWLHGDVKPQNLVISPQGHVTLIDLGFARRLDSVECQTDRWIAGDPDYLAPEGFQSHARLTPAADVYSLGLTLLRLLEGNRDSSSVKSVDRAQRIAQLRADRPDVTRQVATLLTRMLATEPLRRPSANELVESISRLEIESLMQW
jgi:serine/threonine protein kinase